MGSVGGPIKREQDEINRGDSFSQICPAELSLAKERMRKTVREFFTVMGLPFLLVHNLFFF